LILLGIALIAGIYLWDRNKHVDSILGRKKSSRRGRKPASMQHDSSVFDESQESDTPDDEVSAAQSFSAMDDSDVDNGFEMPLAEATDLFEEDNVDSEMSFSARSAFEEYLAGADVPTKIIQINVVAKNAQISGQMILDLVDELGLELGEFSIYHRHDKATGKSIFSMANAVEPGTFDPATMADFRTPALSLFAQLPAPIDCMTAFNEMLNVAQRIAFIVGGELQDNSHSALTKQNIDHIRDSLLEYRRKLQLSLQTA
jgi:cell division protein ZipA